MRGIYFHPEGGYLLATHHGGQVWFVDDNQIIHLLIDGDNRNSTHAGDGLSLSTPGKKVSEVRQVTLSPAGDLIVTEHDGGYIRMARSLWPAGDYDRNGVLDVADIDLLSREARQGTNSRRFDLNQDTHVDDRDRQVWVVDLKRTYFGDANLDGEFNSGDFVDVFVQGQYEDDLPANSTWATGDWDGDAEFTTADFVVAFTLGGYESGPRAAARFVPEPGSLLLSSDWLPAAGITKIGVIQSLACDSRLGELGVFKPYCRGSGKRSARRGTDGRREAMYRNLNTLSASGSHFVHRIFANGGPPS